MIERTNGFVVRARNSVPAAWTPGIWWRLGRCMGVGRLAGGGVGRLTGGGVGRLAGGGDGGLTGEGEAMAELLDALSRGANSES
jgi:hypothetical protein